ncbi:hypothetical protein DXB46_16240 [Lachnospiraceae bacterium OM04-12BH]|nr:hypothetical protein DXB46_16240 [Lachnospiraceae bacterium OM04-12BH]
MVVQHNLTAMNSNRMLGVTTKTQAKSTEKLSSGYKINRAADDAAGLSISEKMRKQIRGLTQASSNAQDGISAVQTAEGALNEVQDMLQRMNELAVKAANGTNSETDRTYIQNEIDQLTTEIDRVSETTKFNETYLLKGDRSSSAYTFKYDSQATKTITGNLYQEDGTTAIADATALKTYLDANPNAKVYKTAASWTVNGTIFAQKAGESGQATAITTTNASKYFNEDGTAKADVTLYKDAAKADTLTLDTTNNVKYTAPTEAVKDTDYTYDSKQYYDADGNKIPANTLNGYFKTSDGATVDVDADSTKKAYDKDGNAVTPAAADVKVDKTLKGVLSLTLHVGADATDNNQISVKIDSMSAASLGVDGIKVDGADDTNALNAVDTIKEAIQKVSTQRSALGAAQNRLEHTINNLDNVVENTTSAESQIRDTDMATEMVKYSNNNILAQAGQAMLAQSNQSNQGVLSLLQ